VTSAKTTGAARDGGTDVSDRRVMRAVTRAVVEKHDHGRIRHGKTIVTIPTGGAGGFEVRLYDEYPSKDHHLVARVPVEVVDRVARIRASQPPSPR
jgi:hypothetical protein